MGNNNNNNKNKKTGRFITAKSRIEQTEDGYWRTIDNELYCDEDGKIYITPRYLWTDGYTFPGLVMAILGDKNFYDARPAHGHDICCRFHEVIEVELTVAQLKEKGYLRVTKTSGKVICENIPMEYLSIKKVSKTWTDNFLFRMMKACEVPVVQRVLIRFGVFFNLNWWLKTGRKSLFEYEIYEDDLGLVNGV